MPNPTRHEVEDAIGVLEYAARAAPEHDARRLAARAASALRTNADALSDGRARASPMGKVGFHDRVPDMRNHPPHSWLKYRVRVEHGGADRDRERDYVDLGHLDPRGPEHGLCRRCGARMTYPGWPAEICPMCVAETRRESGV